MNGSRGENASTGVTVGYARVSTDRQDEARQLKMLRERGITKARDLYVDHAVSGANTSRPEFDRMLSDLEPGDRVVVSELDRLGRNSGHVILTIADLRERGIIVESIGDKVDSSTDAGEAFMGMLAVFANMERRFIQRRTRAGLEQARAEGRVGGRPRSLSPLQVEMARRLNTEGHGARAIAELLKVSESTVYRYLASPIEPAGSDTASG